MLVPAISLTLALTASVGTFEVVDIHRSSVFAGRLGRLVSEELTVRHGSHTLTVRFEESYHTRCGSPRPEFRVGQQVILPSKVDSSVGRIVRLRRDEVRVR